MMNFEVSPNSDEPVWLTSDLHLGHTNILRYGRGPAFGDDLDAMNEGIIERWNSVVAPGDMVLVLGDVAMGHRHETLPLVGRLNGEKHLIAGNHDNCWEHGKNPAKWEPVYLDAGFETIQSEAFLNVEGGRGQPIRLHHFPYNGDHTEEDRYPRARAEDDGIPLLHGHVHDLWKFRHSAEGTPQVNVGLDVWNYTPVPLETAVATLFED